MSCHGLQGPCSCVLACLFRDTGPIPSRRSKSQARQPQVTPQGAHRHVYDGYIRAGRSRERLNERSIKERLKECPKDRFKELRKSRFKEIPKDNDGERIQTARRAPVRMRAAAGSQAHQKPNVTRAIRTRSEVRLQQPTRQSSITFSKLRGMRPQPKPPPESRLGRQTVLRPPLGPTSSAISGNQLRVASHRVASTKSASGKFNIAKSKSRTSTVSNAASNPTAASGKFNIAKSKSRTSTVSNAASNPTASKTEAKPGKSRSALKTSARGLIGMKPSTSKSSGIKSSASKLRQRSSASKLEVKRKPSVSKRRSRPTVRSSQSNCWDSHLSKMSLATQQGSRPRLGPRQHHPGARRKRKRKSSIALNTQTSSTSHTLLRRRSSPRYRGSWRRSSAANYEEGMMEVPSRARGYGARRPCAVTTTMQPASRRADRTISDRRSDKPVQRSVADQTRGGGGPSRAGARATAGVAGSAGRATRRNSSMGALVQLEVTQDLLRPESIRNMSDRCLASALPAKKPPPTGKRSATRSAPSRSQPSSSAPAAAPVANLFTAKWYGSAGPKRRQGLPTPGQAPEAATARGATDCGNLRSKRPSNDADLRCEGGKRDSNERGRPSRNRVTAATNRQPSQPALSVLQRMSAKKDTQRNAHAQRRAHNLRSYPRSSAPRQLDFPLSARRSGTECKQARGSGSRLRQNAKALKSREDLRMSTSKKCK